MILSHDASPHHPDAGLLALARRLSVLTSRCGEARQLLEQSLPEVAAATGAESLAWAAVQQGEWQTVASRGRISSLPTDLLAEALDQGRTQTDGTWLATPLSAGAAGDEILLSRVAPERRPAEDDLEQTFKQAAQLLEHAMATVRRREQNDRRIERLEAILEIAGRWNQTNEMEPLLQQMAETSTRLLGAQRASIFLWDRPNRTLVGRPALGVEGGELRIPDHRGVVGHVVQTGEVRRVDADTGQQEVDRDVDKQLGFTTRTLLCVPLRSREGQLLGVFEMINKIGGNFTAEDEEALTELAAQAAIALENTQQYEQLLRRRRELTEQAADRIRLIGESPSVEALRSTVRRVANTDLALLLLGENGTGKEVVAQMTHYLSDRRDEPFVAVNCAALTETLLESELFGHEKGAFTDAHEARPGKFESASGGTLFLDEIGDLSPSGQAKLLRVLEEKVVVRVGGSVPIHTDTRVIAATNQNLAEMVRARKFREDLFFRLNVVTIELPALRDRGDDVLLLADHFLDEFSRRAGRKPPRLTAAARKRLLQHPWPGNIRELRNLMERLAYLAAGDKIEADELAFILTPGEAAGGLTSMNLPLAEATMRFQTEYIRRQIKNARGNMSEAAKRLGLHRSNLYRKMRQLGMHGADDEDEI